MTEERIRIVVGSNPAYDRLVAEIYWCEDFIGLVSEEIEGQLKFETEAPLKISVDVLTLAIEMALSRLRKLDNLPDA
jgi:hypothetical protein